MRAPVPDMFVFRTTASERLKASTPLLTMAPVPREPLVPPSPTVSLPAAIVVPPVYLLFPVSTSSPPPCWIRRPAPEITFLAVTLSVLLNDREPSLTTAPVPSVPAVPPLPAVREAPDRMRVSPEYVFSAVRIISPPAPSPSLSRTQGERNLFSLVL